MSRPLADKVTLQIIVQDILLATALRDPIVLRHIRLLIFDLDYLVFDCASLKVKALRESLLEFADAIPQSVRLPDEIDAEEGFLEHGHRWPQFLQIGFSEEDLTQLQSVYRVREEHLASAGIGKIYPGMADFLALLSEQGIVAGLGAEASREYLLAVSDRHGLDSLFEMAYCTEEFGMGCADEMIEEIMTRAEVNPSETLVLGTQSDLFQAARNLDVKTIGCGWGLHRHEGLSEADYQSLALDTIRSVVGKADALASQGFI